MKTLIGLCSVSVLGFILFKNMRYKRQKELKESLEKVVRLCKDEYYTTTILINDLPQSRSPSPELTTMILSSNCSTPNSYTMINNNSS